MTPVTWDQMSWQILTDADLLPSPADRQYATAEAWTAWVMASCVEWNRGHQWQLELYHPDDDSAIDLRCQHCPAGVDELYPDGHDLIAAELAGPEGTITVADGHHNSPVPLIIPVHAQVWTERYYSYSYGAEEWDGGIDITQRGPAQPMPDVPDGPDLGLCPFYQTRNLPDTQRGTCTFGCVTEPACITSEPAEGWPTPERRLP